MRKLLCWLIAAGFVLSPFTAQAGQLRDLLRKNFCEPMNEYMGYCEIYMDIRIHGNTPGNAYNGCVQKCESFPDIKERNACKLICETMKNKDPEIVALVKNHFCTSGMPPPEYKGCSVYWSNRFDSAITVFNAYYSCYTQAGDDWYMKTSCTTQNGNDM